MSIGLKDEKHLLVPGDICGRKMGSTRATLKSNVPIFFGGGQKIENVHFVFLVLKQRIGNCEQNHRQCFPCDAWGSFCWLLVLCKLELQSVFACHHMTTYPRTFDWNLSEAFQDIENYIESLTVSIPITDGPFRKAVTPTLQSCYLVTLKLHPGDLTLT